MKQFDLNEKPNQIWNMDECSIDEKTATKKKHYGVKGEQSYQLKVIFTSIL